MIGVIGAMKVEIEGLKAMLADPVTETISGIDFTSGRLGKVPVVLAVCGVGKVFAALCAQTMILRYQVSALINTGVAGTLCRELGIGDVAVSSDVVQHDMDTATLGDDVGMISGLNLVHLPADPALVRLAEAAVRSKGIRCLVGTIATGDQFLCDAGRKQWIHDTFHAIAGEMEGGSIGQVCYVNRVPFVILRAISDDADGHAPENFAAFVEQTARTSVEMTAALVKGMSDEQGMGEIASED
jgi:adenosylhomocysteine nucleosidase